MTVLLFTNQHSNFITPFSLLCFLKKSGSLDHHDINFPFKVQIHLTNNKPVLNFRPLQFLISYNLNQQHTKHGLLLAQKTPAPFTTVTSNDCKKILEKSNFC
jgi:hypothetical protein